MMKANLGEDFDYGTFRMKTMDRMDAEIERDGLELKQGVKELFAYLKKHHTIIILIKKIGILNMF